MPKVYDKVNSHRKPDWLKAALPSGADCAEVGGILRRNALHTICVSGRCPNQSDCWGRRTATFMILGDVCTRSCRFCATATGGGLPIDADEPRRVAQSVRSMGLRHAVITSVTRDDLPDGGAGHWAATVKAVKSENPETTVELLIPDMDGRADLLDIVLEAGADVVGHNVETVRRLTPGIRSRARYETSLGTIAHISSRGVIAKSGLMLGLGETEEEVLRTLDDLRAAGCRIVTLGQYLRPSLRHAEVEEYVTPEMFEYYRVQALARGFLHAASGPLVRSSYRAAEALEHCKNEVK